MAIEFDDWRLRTQDEYLKGLPLFWRRWKAPRPDWDHDHCDFCWAKFMEEGACPEATEPLLHEGWTTADDCWWVCPECFADFRERFGWTVGGQDSPCGTDRKAP